MPEIKMEEVRNWEKKNADRIEDLKECWEEIRFDAIDAEMEDEDFDPDAFRTAFRETHDLLYPWREGDIVPRGVCGLLNYVASMYGHMPVTPINREVTACRLLASDLVRNFNLGFGDDWGHSDRGRKWHYTRWYTRSDGTGVQPAYPLDTGDLSDMLEFVDSVLRDEPDCTFEMFM